MKRTAIFFPGQGPQYPGMGRVFYEKSAAVRHIYHQASDWLHYDLARHSFEGSLDGISDTRFAQPAILVAGLAAYSYYIENIGLAGRPSFLAGHSMGEITALLCAGALNFEDALQLTVKRGELMKRVSEAKGGTMAAIKDFYWKDTENVCRQTSTEERHVSVAAYNSEWQTIVTGDATAVEAVGRACAESGGIFMPLNITVASHCPFMSDILKEYGDFVSRLKISHPEIAVYSCLTGKQYSSPREIVNNLTHQLTRPVLWNNILNDIVRKDTGIFIDAGPGAGLGKLVPGTERILISLEKNSIDQIRSELGQQVRFIPTPLTKCLSLLISVPDLSDNPKNYEEIFLKNYRDIQSLQDKLEKEERLPDQSEIRTAVALLEPSCRAKMIPRHLEATLKAEMLKEFPYTADFFPAHPTRSTSQHEEVI